MTELFAAIAIVGVVAAIMLRVLAHFREKARHAGASNLRQIGRGILRYIQDHPVHSGP